MKTNVQVSLGRLQASDIVQIIYLNVQGLTASKYAEIVHMILGDKLRIVCLVEINHKRDNFHVNKDINFLSKYRKIGDKNGGGIWCLWNSKFNIKIEEIQNPNPDILPVNVQISNFNLKLIITYLATNDDNRNNKIYKELDKLSEHKPIDNMLIVGDFNGHIGSLGPQPPNSKGKKMLQYVDRNNLNILNLDPRCSGEITRKQNDAESVIDFFLINENLYNSFIQMTIDEEGAICNFSDHNLMFADFFCSKQEIPSNDKKISYLKRNEENIDCYLACIEDLISEQEVHDISDFNSIISYARDRELLVEFTTKGKKKNKGKSCWITEEIIKEIAKKRQINKSRRKEIDQIKKIQLNENYQQQKEKVQNMVSQAIEKFEVELTRKILDDKDKNKKIWRHTFNLINRSYQEPTITEIYDENGKIPMQNTSSIIKSHWNQIYQSQINDIEHCYDAEERKQYRKIFSERAKDAAEFITGIDLQTGNIVEITENVELMPGLAEHLDATSINIIRPKPRMDSIEITKSDIVYRLKKITVGKAPGPDTIQPELYKYFTNSDIILEKLVILLNHIIETSQVPDAWRLSKTVMIPKKSKPRVDELRPIALTDTSYKIIMGIVKEYIDRFLRETDQLNPYQSGGTCRRRVTENIYILSYCIEKSFRRKKQLFALSIDFKKAFDSVNRLSMINVLKDIKIHPNIVELIANIYTNDKTDIYMNKELITTIEISSGIRQGCTLSALLFTLVSYKIIEEINNLKMGFRDEDIQIDALFYMDDAIILADEEYKIMRVLNKIDGICAKYGLFLNKDKCKILIFNSDLVVEEINEIKVENSTKYLGIMIENSRMCFNLQKKKLYESGLKFVNMIYSILGKCCNRMLIGKTYWKGLVLPNILYGTDVIGMRSEDISKLQTLDNMAYRFILKVPKYTAIEFLRGEVGASAAISRDMKNKLMFLRHALSSDENPLLKQIVLSDIQNKCTKWAKNIADYLNELNISLTDACNARRDHLEDKIRKWDSQKWKANMEPKKTLVLYKEMKQNPDEVKWFKNGYKYAIMMQARSNSLNLGWRGLTDDKNKLCRICNLNTVETLTHFLILCPTLQPVRSKNLLLQLPNIENIDEISKIFLLYKQAEHLSNIDLINILFELWMERDKTLKRLQ